LMYTKYNIVMDLVFFKSSDIVKEINDVKVFIDNYLNNMDYVFMKRIADDDINNLSKEDFYKLGFQDYHYEPCDGLNKDGLYFIFNLPFIRIGDLFIEVLDGIYSVLDDDNNKKQLYKGQNLIDEIYIFLNIDGYEKELEQLLLNYLSE